MFKTALISSFIGLAGVPALSQNDVNPVALTTSGSVALCPETVQGIARLRQYGHRYDKAIDLILAEAAKPHWGWDGCEESGPKVVVSGANDPAFNVAARQ